MGWGGRFHRGKRFNGLFLTASLRLFYYTIEATRKLALVTVKDTGNNIAKGLLDTQLWWW